jgi:very-short-patch-repair endonuclease
MARRPIIPYSPRLKQFARRLRKEGTMGEALLWTQLQKRQQKGFRFHRQRPIDQYIVDFYCEDLRLVIEIDGSSHDESRYDRDQARQARLEQLGLYVLRFSEQDVQRDLLAVVEAIRDWIDRTRPAD